MWDCCPSLMSRIFFFFFSPQILPHSSHSQEMSFLCTDWVKLSNKDLSFYSSFNLFKIYLSPFFFFKSFFIPPLLVVYCLIFSFLLFCALPGHRMLKFFKIESLCSLFALYFLGILWTLSLSKHQHTVVPKFMSSAQTSSTHISSCLFIIAM